MNACIFRDIDELKIWGNEQGFRFHRDLEDKTKYKVYFTDDDVDKLEAFVRQQQAEIEELKAKLQLHGAMDNQCASLMQQFRKAQEK